MTRVGEAGDDGADPLGGGDLAGVDHDEQLHEVVVDLAAAGLDDVDVLPPHGLTDFDAAKNKVKCETEMTFDLRGI